MIPTGISTCIYLYVCITELWYYDDNQTFPVEASLKQTSSLYEKKSAIYFFQISLRSRDIQVFKICKLAR